MILPFSVITVFNWIMFVLIMISICGHTQRPVAGKQEADKIKVMKTNFTIAATLAVMFGLGWALGLVATSLPVKELTLAFQILFSIFVGTQGILIFLLHGVRNQDIRRLWIQWFTMIVRKSHLTSIISSTKTSSAGPQNVRAGGLSSGASTLPRKRDASASTVENTYNKPPYAESSMGGSVAMEMAPVSKGHWGPWQGDQQHPSFVSDNKKHVNDDVEP